ncbi:MAG: IPT/TIG domain-containing protein [Dysgonamonadaceae bacterium]|nr:IPT/TIG domain-containing protein [Dysgonamonadaceae bacterium]
MPSISIEPDTVVCAGGATTVRVEINGGTPPYNFEITNSNTSDVISQIDYDDDSFSFTIHPLIPVSYYISDFSDLYTDSVTYLPFGLFPPAGQDYFDDANILVIITEILVITPNEGPVVGGTFTGDPNNPVDPNGIITIIGYGFNAFGEEPLVMFEDRPATNVTVYDQYTITCTPPAHPSGYVAVSVITACGTFTFNNGYLYNSMDIAGVSPAYSPVTGGTVVTIQGVGFLSAAELADDVTVTFCGVPATIISVADNQIVCQTGVSSYSQLGDIDIFNGTETSTFAGRFTYYPVVFIKNGLWSEAYNWETQTDDRILPYPNAVIHIKANCLQDIDLRSGGSFPYGQAMDSITVYPNKAYTLGTGRMLDANVFTLKDDASFLNYGNMNATQQNVEHLLTQGRNWYISSPLEILSGSLTANRDWIEQYDETTHLWQRPGTGLTVGCGYTIFSAAEDIALKYSGTYNDGNRMSPGLTRQNDAHPKRGFNLVGNPFPSYWRWTAAAASNANVYSTIWYRTNVAGVYEFWSYNASGDVAAMPGWEDATPTGSYSLAYIPPIQAFWVRILDGQSAGTLTFTNNNRAHADHSSNVLKSAETQSTETRPLLRLVVNNGVRADETVIYADPKAKNGFDTYDSDKWFTNQGAEIFTLPVSSTRELVINGLSEIKDSTEVTLGFQANEGGAFNFRAKEILNLDAFDVFLSDKWRKIEFDLRDGDYNFTSSSVSVTDRFSIIFRRNADMSTKDAGDNLLAYTDKNGQVIVILNLRNQQGNDVNVSVFDIIGRKLTEQPVIVGERTILKGTFPRGVYVLRSGKCVTKIQISSSQP